MRKAAWLKGETGKGMILGVTGLPCTGKSFAAERIASGDVFGKPGELIKADDLGHAVLEYPDIRETLRQRFGDETFRDPAPAAVRRALAARVFDDPEALTWLEALLHPPILHETEAIIARAEGRLVVVEAALLFPGGLDRLCDVVMVMEATPETRMRRAAARGWTREDLERRERRLLPLFSEESLALRKGKFIRIANDRDDNSLWNTIRSALTTLYKK